MIRSSFHTLIVQVLINEVDTDQGRYTLLLHGDTVQSVHLFHRTTSVGNDDELGVLCQLMSILCKTAYVGIIQRRLDLVQQTKRGGL